MNKNIKQVLVRVEYHNQIWFEYMDITDVKFRWPRPPLAISGRGRYFEQRIERRQPSEDREGSRSSSQYSV